MCAYCHGHAAQPLSKIATPSRISVEYDCGRKWFVCKVNRPKP